MRIYLIAAAVLAIIGCGLRYHHVAAKAARVDAAETKAVAAEQRALDIAENATKAAAVNRGISQDLATFRSELSAQSLTFNQALTSRPLTREIVREVNGVTTTCRERDPVRYRELFNQAVTGAANP